MSDFYQTRQIFAIWKLKGVTGWPLIFCDTSYRMICTLCEIVLPRFALPPVICSGCEVDIFSYAVMGKETVAGHDVHVAFDYDDIIRELVVRSKIKNDLVALGFLLKSLQKCAHNVISRFDIEGTLIVPTPSSLWGRFRGRFDIAQMVSQALFTRAQVFQGVLPGTLFKAKRAGRNAEVGYGWLSRFEMALNFNDFKKINAINDLISQSNRILVVDDVMTTGFTMKTLFDQLKRLGAQSIDGLVIASSSSARSGVNDFFNDDLKYDVTGKDIHDYRLRKTHSHASSVLRD